MPHDWYDRHSVSEIEDEEQRKFMYSVLADKKPRFMIYIYPTLMKEYKKYLTNTDKKCQREFEIGTDDLQKIPVAELTDRQAEFLRSYRLKMPVGLGPCVMNIICEKIEAEFDHWMKKMPKPHMFDYSILKSEAQYTRKQFNDIKELYKAYMRRVRDYKVFTSRERVDDDVAYSTLATMSYTFRKECDVLVNNEEVLCNIMLDLCYRSNTQKTFVWSLCSDVLIRNLGKNSGGKIRYPVKDPNGNIIYAGKRFSLHESDLEV